MRCWLLIGALSSFAVAYGHASPPPDNDREMIGWPSGEYPTLQSAIDGLRDGGRLRIAPGVFEIGQPLLVRNRDIVIEGAGCRDLDRRGRHGSPHTRLVGPRPSRVPAMGHDTPLIGVSGSGGLVLRGLELSGFDSGIGVMDGEATEPGRLHLTVEDTCVVQTVRGIASTHSLLTLVFRNVLIRDALWNGVSIGPAMALADVAFISYGSTIANPKQACIVVKHASYTAFNTHLQDCGFDGLPGAGGGILAVDSSVVFVDSSVNAPNGPGIAARGGATLVEGSLVFLARGAGILLFEPQSAAVHDSHVWLTQAFPGGHPQAGAFGDGLAIAGGGSLWVGDTLVEDSARAGLSNFGSYASLGDLQIECAAAFDLEGENFLGQNFSFADRGGNKCGCPDATGACEAVSIGLVPPGSINPIP